MLKRNAVAMAISSLLMASAAQAATIYENENGDYLKLYGEVGVGGHIGANFEYGEFYTTRKATLMTRSQPWVCVARMAECTTA